MQHISAKDFFKKCTYNCETQNQLWCSQIADGHDNFCSCQQPFAHLLASIFPPGHQDREYTINQILARDYTERCLSGGDEERKLGGESSNIKEEETTDTKGDFQEEESIDALLAAAAAAAEDTR